MEENEAVYAYVIVSTRDGICFAPTKYEMFSSQEDAEDFAAQLNAKSDGRRYSTQETYI
jgi:hypothetical protein